MSFSKYFYFKSQHNTNRNLSIEKNPFLNRRQTNNSDDEQLITERKSEVIGAKNDKNTSDLKNNSQLNRVSYNYLSLMLLKMENYKSILNFHLLICE